MSTRKAYDAGHIPGALGFNWQSQLQDQIRRDIIGKQEFERLLSAAKHLAWRHRDSVWG